MLDYYRFLFSDNKAWIVRIICWAILWAMVGASSFYFHPELFARLESYLRSIFTEILGRGPLPLNLSTTLAIFRNNLLAAFVTLFGGVILGLLPLIGVAVNFYILGFLLAAFVVPRGFEGLFVFVASVLPHAVLEIPTFILAAAFGLRFGVSWVKPMPGLGVRQSFFLALRRNFEILPVLVALFFLAAVLEVFVSGSLAKWIGQ